MVQYVVAGLVIGCIYAIASVGLVMTYRASGILNFALGGEAYGAARMFYFLNTQHKWSSWSAAIVCILVVSPAFGALLYYVLFRYLKSASALVKIIVTVGLGVTIPPLSAILFGNEPISLAPGLVPAPVPTYSVLGVAVTLDQVIVVACLLMIVVIGFLVLRYTEVGLLVRAMVDSPAMTSLAGGNPATVSLAVSIVTTLMAGLVGVLLAPIVGLSASNYGILIAAAFTAVLIAKFTRIGVAILVSIAIGLVSSGSEYFLPPTSAITSGVVEGMPFVFILAFLLWEARRGFVVESLSAGGPVDQAIAGGGPGTATRGYAPPALRLHMRPSSRRIWDARATTSLIAVGLAIVLSLAVTPFWVGELGEGACFGVIFLSFTVVVGEGGMTWLCQAAFAGVGAVLTAHLASADHVPVLAAILVSALVTLPAGLIIGALTTRLGELYVALATLAFGILLNNLVLSQAVFAGPGEGGVVVPRAGFLVGPRAFLYFTLGVFAACSLLIEHYRRSTAGLAMSAVRGSEAAARSTGINATGLRVAISGAAAFLAALGGGMLAMNLTLAVPSSFDTIGGLVWLAVLVTVGVRSNVAALWAGIAFVAIPALLQAYLPFTWQQLPAVGFGLGAILLARNPDGLVAMHSRQARALIGHVTGLRRPKAGQDPSAALKTDRPVPAIMARELDRNHIG